jgi:type IX secretion system PorP/SprF family membrane protein
MKRLIITFSFVATFCCGAGAQTRPQQSMYMFNYSFLNPAAIGIEDYSQLRVGLRRQWAGIDGAPSTAWLSGDMRLRTKEQSTDTQPETFVINKGHGLGLNLYTDKIGPYATVNLNIGYAYHMPLSSGLTLSAGFAGGLHRTQYNLSKTVYPDQPADPATVAQASMTKKYSPDLNAGILLNGKRFFTGLSLLQILPSRFVDASNSESKYRKQLLGAIGYSFPLDDEGTGLWLSGILKTDFAGPLRYDVSAKLRFQHLFWIGSTYRKDDALGTGLGLNITKNLSVGYLYEWGIDRHISAYSKGSHEICIGFRFLKENQPNETRMGW